MMMFLSVRRRPRFVIRPHLLALLIVLLSICLSPKHAVVRAQDYYGDDGAGEDYQDYADPYGQQDDLYADYAAHQQEKVQGGGGG